MSRLLLFMIFGIILIAGLAIFWFAEKETVNEKNVPSPELVEESRPVKKETPQSETPSDALRVEAASDEETPKPASVNRQKFESEDETTDTNDAVTIEVEPEE